MGRGTDKTSWAQSIAARIGMGGTIDFTPANVGQTLHLPCSGGGGHKVDVKIAPGQHPDAVAKKLLNSGWVLGNKLKCPRHARKSKAELAGSAAQVALRESLDKVEIGWGDKKPITPQESGRLRWKGMTKEQRQEAMKPITAARLNKQQQEGKSDVASAVAVEKSVEQMSADARKAHRLVIAALEDYYDDRTSSYRRDYSDKRIAEELKISESSVAKTREDFFGPLAQVMPPEIAEMIKAVATARENLVTCHKQAMADIDTVSAKLVRFCEAKGWAIA